MKKTLLASIAAAAFYGAPAFAADMPVKAPPTIAASNAAPSWTGWYLGLNAGGNWGRSRTSTAVSDSTVGSFFNPAAVARFNAIGGPTNVATSGFIGGVHGGYNYQMGQWLVGIEADFDYFRSSGSNITSGPGAVPGVTFNVTSSMNTDWLFTARPRLGIISNNWLFYGTGGLAVTRIKAAWGFNNSGTIGVPGSPVIVDNASASSTKAGLAVGGGIETMLPGKWVIGAEYLYMNFGSVSATSVSCCQFGIPLAFTNPISHSADLSANIVRARLTKLF